MAQAKTYTAPHDVYTGGRLYTAGEPFTTAEKKGEEWVSISPAEEAAIEASDPVHREDPDLDNLGLEALRAVATEKRVSFQGLSKKDLLTAIKAANEPRL